MRDFGGDFSVYVDLSVILLSESGLAFETHLQSLDADGEYESN